MILVRHTINGVNDTSNEVYIMKVMGIDASTTCSGVAVIEDGNLVYHDIIDMKKILDVY